MCSSDLYVIQDAHGQICDYLISKGYTNLYTEKSYKYFPRGTDLSSGLDIVNLLTDKEIENMKFDVVTGNPPYQDSKNNDIASNLWSKFWVKALRLTKDDGVVSLITPFSWCSPSQDFKKIADAYEGDRRLWDTFNRFTSIADVENVKQYFPGVGSSFSRVTVYSLVEMVCLLPIQNLMHILILDSIHNLEVLMRLCLSSIKRRISKNTLRWMKRVVLS